MEGTGRRRCQPYRVCGQTPDYVPSLLQRDAADIDRLCHTFDSAASAISLLQQEAFMAPANHCLCRRDAEISKPPSGVPEETQTGPAGPPSL